MTPAGFPIMGGLEAGCSASKDGAVSGGPMSDATRNFSAAEPPAEGTADLAESVGTALRKARERRGLTLPQVSRDLCLKEDVLRALESRQYGALPKVPYCFGFVRTYARHLGLEPQEMVRRFKAEIGDVPQNTKITSLEPLRSGRFPGRAVVTFSLLMAAAGYTGWYFYTERPAEITVPATSADASAPMAPVPLIDSETARKLNQASAAPDSAGTAESDPGKTGATTSSAPPVAIKGKVVIRATGACWVYIHDQKGKVVFHKTMQKGDEFVVPEPRPELVMELGNPAALNIVVDGRTLKPIAGAGQARRISLDPKELAKLP